MFITLSCSTLPSGGMGHHGAERQCVIFLIVHCGAQLQLARSHGLPAVRLSELRCRSAELNGLHKHRRPLPASLLRDWLGKTATAGTMLHVYVACAGRAEAAAPANVRSLRTCAIQGHMDDTTRVLQRALLRLKSCLLLPSAGLGSAASRSVLRQFDDVVATLELALNDLRISHALLARCSSDAYGASAPRPYGSVVSASATSVVVDASIDDGRTTRAQCTAVAGVIDTVDGIDWLSESTQRAAAMSTKLVEWRRVVTSHQSATRVLRWSVSQAGTCEHS
jgi:hypothetical protein